MRLVLLVLFAFLFSQSGAIASTCYGAYPCEACHTCGYCKHCAKQGGKCGVCDPRGRRVEMFAFGNRLIEIESGLPTQDARICMIERSGE